MPLLAVERLAVAIGGTPVLEDVSLALEPGRVLGLVGESGSGKSMTALAVMGLLPPGAVATGSIRLAGRELVGLPERAWTGVRGGAVGLVFQEPMTALNPLMTISAQVAEAVVRHTRHPRRTALLDARALLARVGLPEADVPASRYPHQLSGGQRQRVVIAMAIAARPRLLIADEPTSALDVLVQAEILDLLGTIVREDGTAMILVSHDLGVVAGLADAIAVMERGRIVETGPAPQILTSTAYPHTRRLIAAARLPAEPKIAPVKQGVPLVEARDLVRAYPLRRAGLLAPRRSLRAVDGVSFDVRPGESVGLVGASGSGKSTLARLVLGLDRPDAGTVRVAGLDPAAPHRRARAGRLVQAVFQDPASSFDPRHRVGRIVAEPLHTLNEVGPAERRDRAAAALARVGLGPEALDRYPHEFSGGQRQRIAIARAIIVEPKLVVADEPVSALDVSLRGQILDLLADLGARLGIAYLFISHDLAVVRSVTTRVMVMQAGRVVESGSTGRVLAAPEHPYTRLLVARAPDIDAVLARRRAAAP